VETRRQHCILLECIVPTRSIKPNGTSADEQNGKLAAVSRVCVILQLECQQQAKRQIDSCFSRGHPSVGPVAALSFMTAIDDSARFKRSRGVAAYLG
jgi:hypothetical protein